jgi:hypothetical protein
VLLGTPVACAQAPPAEPAPTPAISAPAPSASPAAPAPSVSATKPASSASRPKPAAEGEAPVLESNGAGISSGRKRVSSGPHEGSRPASPPLDLAALEKRLRDTDAIGVFTKLTLKNQVDDLLERFRAFYDGRLQVPLAELRQAYDLLLLKTITVVQDGDPALAKSIASSREPLWTVLSDRDQFAALEARL